MNLPTSDNYLIKRLQQNDESVFKKIFDTYYKYLTTISYRYLKESEKAKDIAQEAFIELWKRRNTLQITTGIKSYLRQIVINKSLNYIKREKRIDFLENAQLPEETVEPDAIQQLAVGDLQKTIQKAVDSLPKRCRLIFCMSRYDEKSHKEISEALGISKKTIESQMTIALRILRKAVYNKTPLTLFFLLHFFLGGFLVSFVI